MLFYQLLLPLLVFPNVPYRLNAQLGILFLLLYSTIKALENLPIHQEVQVFQALLLGQANPEKKVESS